MFNLFRQSQKQGRAQRRRHAYQSPSQSEVLEARQLPTNQVTVAVMNGQISVIGTPQDDEILIDREGDQIVFRGSSFSQSSIPVASLSALAEGYVSFFVEGRGGNDKITNNTSFRLEIRGGEGNDILQGGPGHDVLLGGDGHDILQGQAGIDYLAGEGGNDTLLGGGDDDGLSGGSGDDQLNGGDGVDSVSYGDAPQGVKVYLKQHVAFGDGTDILDGIENVYGSPYADEIHGDDTDNELSGGSNTQSFSWETWTWTYAIDSIYGHGGDDVLRGGRGDDVLNGGDGADAVSYEFARSAVQVYLAAGVSYGGDGSDTLINMENVVGSMFSDFIVGNDEANVLLGGESGDIIYGGGGDDTVNGGQGFDFISGDAGYDLLVDHASEDGVDLGADGGDIDRGQSGNEIISFVAVTAQGHGSVLRGVGNSNSGALQRSAQSNSTIQDLSESWIAKNAQASSSFNQALNNGIGFYGKNHLFIFGTPSGDQISIKRPSGAQTSLLEVTWFNSNGTPRMSKQVHFSGIKIWVFGIQGNDYISADPNVNAQFVMFGGSGRDTLKGGSRADILHGESDKDELHGGTNDRASDSLWGDGGSDSFYDEKGDHTDYKPSGPWKDYWLASQAKSGIRQATASTSGPITTSPFEPSEGGAVVISTSNGSPAETPEIAYDLTDGVLTITASDHEDTIGLLAPAGESQFVITTQQGNLLLSKSDVSRIVVRNVADEDVVNLAGLDPAIEVVLLKPVAPEPVVEPPTITPELPGTFSLNENALVGVTAFTVSLVENSAAPREYEFRIVGVNPGNAFSVDANGVVRVANSASLDFEANAAISLTVEVSVVGSPLARVSKSFTVRLNDLVEAVTVRPEHWEGTSGLVLRQIDGMLHVQDARSQRDVVAPHLLTKVSAIDVIGRAGFADVLTVNGSEGDPVPSGGLSFRGDLGEGDALRIVSTAIAQLDINMPGLNTGTMSRPGAVGGVISWTGVESVVLDSTSVIAMLNVTLTNGADRVTVSDDDDPQNGLTRLTSSTTSSLTFSLFSQTSIDLAGGNDVVTTKSVDPVWNPPLPVSIGIPHAKPLTVYGGAGNDALTGSELADSLFGGVGNDTLDGGAGNDVLSGGDGNDSLIGGLGSDQIVESGVSKLTLSKTSMTGRGTDKLIGVESALLSGTDGNDTLSGGTFAGTIFIDGRGGNDLLTGGVGNDTLLGGDGNDKLSGLGGNDMIRGQAGNDQILGGGGNDTLDGGDGNDTVNGEAGNDTLLGGDGNDSLLGGADHDSIAGQAGRDTLKGEAGNDLLFGGVSDDSLSGGTGNDTLLGEEGKDTLRGEAGNDVVFDPFEGNVTDASLSEKVQVFAVDFDAIFQALLLG